MARYLVAPDLPPQGIDHGGLLRTAVQRARRPPTPRRRPHSCPAGGAAAAAAPQGRQLRLQSHHPFPQPLLSRAAAVAAAPLLVRPVMGRGAAGGRAALELRLQRRDPLPQRHQFLLLRRKPPPGLLPPIPLLGRPAPRVGRGGSSGGGSGGRAAAAAAAAAARLGLPQLAGERALLPQGGVEAAARVLGRGAKVGGALALPSILVLV
jgi:hypothetical protein